MVGFFFFKQKTAYEMRSSDWSSDVCSSDLGARELPIIRAGKLAFNVAARTARSGDHVIELTRREADLLELLIRRAGAVVRRSTIEDALYRFDEPVTQIGRAHV